MYSSGAEPLATSAKSLIDRAKQAAFLDTQGYTELQQIMNDLVGDLFSSSCSFSSQGSGRDAEVGLFLVGEMLSDPSIYRLYECGIRSAALVLCAMPLAIANVSSQGSNERSSVYSSQITDTCLSRLTSAGEEIIRRLDSAVASGSSNSNGAVEVADLLCLATVYAECTSEVVERLSAAGDDGLLQSPMIWKSAMDNTSAVALHIFKIFESGCRIHLLCLNQALKQQRQYHEQCDQMSKASGKLIVLVSAIFGSKTHLEQDAGMKRSLLLRFCERVLSVHKAMLGSAHQFKAVWESLCTIVTSFSASASFGSSGMCAKVYIQSCDTVRCLAEQLGVLLRRHNPTLMRDQKVEQRAMRTGAFIKFIVYQMSGLLSRIYTADSASKNGDGSNSMTFPAALAMAEDVLHELAEGRTRCGAALKTSTVVMDLVYPVISKHLAALFKLHLAPIVDYMDSLQLFVSSSSIESSGQTISQVPLITGVRHAATSREILRMLALDFSAFSADQQKALLTRGAGLVQALSLSIDCNPVEALPFAFACTGQISDDLLSSATDYEKYALALATCATKLAEPAHYGYWETGALAAILQSPAGSLGARVVAEAWTLLARHTLSRELVLSTMASIIETTLSGPQLDSAHCILVRRLFAGFVAPCNDGELIRLLSDVSRRFLQPDNPTRPTRTCALIPWHAFGMPAAQGFVGSAAKLMAGMLGSRTLDYDVGVAAALAALAPAVAKHQAAVPGLVSNIYASAYTVLERCCMAQDSESSTSHVVEELLCAVAQLPADDAALAGRLLELCTRHVDCRALASPAAQFQLTEFIGCYVVVNLGQHTASKAIQQARALTAHLLDAKRPWIVRHAMYLQIIRFATEPDGSSAVELLVPGHLQTDLVDFIHRSSASDPLNIGDAVGDVRIALYRSVLDQPLASYSVGLARRCSSLVVGGEACGADSSLLDAIRALRHSLDAASGTASGLADVVRAELARLVQTIQHI